MTINVSNTSHSVKLTAISGANPLGFLAALGTLIVARQSGYPNARLGWERSVSWTPILDCGIAVDPSILCQALSTGMSGKQISSDAEEKRKEAQCSFDVSKKVLNDKQKDIKKRRLRGKDYKAAIDSEISPLQEAVSERRKVRLEALKNAVPRAELSLGVNIKDCTEGEYRDHAFNFLEDADHDNRETVDLLAAFGCDASVNKYGRIIATRFCFITGAGHQHFLDTVRQLMTHITPERVHAALFEPWIYRDDGCSLRWDPVEDRRYALMDRDPAPLGSRTVWMANLLAYRSLTLFPSVSRRGGLSTTAWSLIDEVPTFTWPIWQHPSAPDSIRSLLHLHELSASTPDRSTLVERGVVAAFRAKRIQVGKFINFSPAQSLFAQHPSQHQ